MVISVEISNQTKELEETAKEYVNYYINRPYLKIDEETKKLLFGDRTSEDVDKFLGVYRRKRSRQIHLFQVEEQEKLDQLAQKLKDGLNDVPYRKYGYIPAKKNYMGLVTYMFFHGGWWHLIGNLLLLYLTGPFIEDVWGRPIFGVFYIIAGIFSGFMFSLYSPNFTGPLIGASGAIAGLMGVFLIRYWKTKIKFWIFLTHITFKAPAWLMLPIWLALEIFSANSIDSVSSDGGGVAHWAHIWGFIFGVVVAALMKRFKVEETHVHPKIESQVHFVDEGYKAFEEANLKISEGKVDEAYGLLLSAARKDPMNRDVVEKLWNHGNELGKEKETAEFFTRLIESEIRRDQMDVAFVHYMDLRGKVPQASISMTCKFMLMKYLTDRQDYKEAKELTTELIEEVDLNASPILLQDLAKAASEHSPEVAKKAVEMCLQHPGISDIQKDDLKKKLKELDDKIQAIPAASDMGQPETTMDSMEHEITVPESQPGLEQEGQPASGPKVQPLAESVGQTREELIGQVDVNPESKPAVVTDLQYKTQPEGQPAVKQESQAKVEPLGKPIPESGGQPNVVPESQPVTGNEGQLKVEPESQPGAEPEAQSIAEPVIQPAVEPEVQPLAESVGQTKEELIGQVDVNPESKPAVVTDLQYKTQPEGQPAVKQESQAAVEPLGKPLPESGGQPNVVPESQPVTGNENQFKVEPESQPGAEPEAQSIAEPVSRPAPEPEGQPNAAPKNQPSAEPEVQSEAEPESQPAAENESQLGAEPEAQPMAESASQPAAEPEVKPGVEQEGQPPVETQAGPLVKPEGQPSVVPESQSTVEPVDQPELEPDSPPLIEPDKPKRSPSLDKPIKAINATPLSVKDGKITLNMDKIGQQLLPLNEVKFIAVVEIAPDQELPYLLIDLFLDNPKTENNEIRTIRLLSTSFDPTRFSPGIQDSQDALRVFVSVLLKLSGATAYPDEDSILLEEPQTFISIEDYEKSILS